MLKEQLLEEFKKLSSEDQQWIISNMPMPFSRARPIDCPKLVPSQSHTSIICCLDNNNDNRFVHAFTCNKCFR